MNNLVIALISIALISILGSATYWHGGNTYTEASVSAGVTKLKTEGEQIQSAINLYKSKGNTLDSGFTLSDLVAHNYLTKIPDGWSQYPGEFFIAINNDNEDYKQSVCFEANKEKGIIFSSLANDVVIYNNDPDYAIPYCYNEDASEAVCCIRKTDG